MIYYETPFCLVMVVLAAVVVVVVVAAAVSDDHGYCVCHLNKNKDLSFLEEGLLLNSKCMAETTVM